MQTRLRQIQSFLVLKIQKKFNPLWEIMNDIKYLSIVMLSRYSKTTKPFCAFIIAIVWTNECEEAFETLKEALVSAPILKPPY